MILVLPPHGSTLIAMEISLHHCKLMFHGNFRIRIINSTTGCSTVILMLSDSGNFPIWSWGWLVLHLEICSISKYCKHNIRAYTACLQFFFPIQRNETVVFRDLHNTSLGGEIVNLGSLQKLEILYVFLLSNAWFTSNSILLFTCHYVCPCTRWRTYRNLSFNKLTSFGSDFDTMFSLQIL